MTVITSKQQQRIGNLADLPVGPLNGLLPGEFGYATNAKRLFIGNVPLTATCDGVVADFTFNVDLNSMYQGGYKLYHEASGSGTPIDITSSINAIAENSVNNVESSTVTLDPIPDVGVLTLYYNTELDTFTADQSFESMLTASLPSGSAVATPIKIPTSRYKYVNVNYRLEDAAGNARTGVIRLTPVGSSTAMIKDEYDTTSYTDLDHIFTVTNDGTDMELGYSSSDNADIFWFLETWQS